MNINEKEAIEKAIEFSKQQKKSSSLPLRYESATAVLNNNGRRVSFLSIEGEHWLVLFKFDGITTMDPDYVIVAVSAESGEAQWYPLL